MRGNDEPGCRITIKLSLRRPDSYRDTSISLFSKES